ncbi:hypothetical protein COV82_05420 [Candidatus Peregrinibacteria bacterium CG11_big_fil_rev_8_21_14_0_20_46_8]|nr:MAG: hypothetical protein COV82_05420 [Candidatus Peregrinibacteria bacterium CG11_big_fil_rev_8_21_14_0_20_46_8]
MADDRSQKKPQEKAEEPQPQSPETSAAQPVEPAESSESFLDFLSDGPKGPAEGGEGEGESEGESEGEPIEGEIVDEAEDKEEEEILIENEQAETKQAAQEIIGGAEGEGAEPAHLEEEGGFGDRVVEILEELNIGRRHIFYGLGCLGLIVVLFLGARFGLDFLRDRGADEIPPIGDEEPEVPDETGLDAVRQIGDVSEERLARIGSTGLQATVAVGDERQQESRIVDYILTFRQMKNAFEVNIDELLAGTTDRRAKLRAHVALLRLLHMRGTNNLEQLNQEIAQIRSAFEVGRQEEAILDENFFEQLDALNAELTQSLLDEFIIVTQQQAGLRARFQALAKIQSLYTDALPRIAALIRAIELNEESLVQGIKFFDVPNIDLDLLRVAPPPAENGEVGAPEGATGGAADVPTGGAASDQRPPSSLGTAPGSFRVPNVGTGLPVHPADVTTERDFITQPGGGFEVGPGGQ